MTFLSTLHCLLLFSSPFMILCKEKYGWKRYQSGNITLWFNGYVYNWTVSQMVKKVRDLYNVPNRMADFLKSIDGHFAIMAEGTD